MPLQESGRCQHCDCWFPCVQSSEIRCRLQHWAAGDKSLIKHIIRKCIHLPNIDNEKWWVQLQILKYNSCVGYVCVFYGFVFFWCKSNSDYVHVRDLVLIFAFFEPEKDILVRFWSEIEPNNWKWGGEEVQAVARDFSLWWLRLLFLIPYYIYGGKWDSVAVILDCLSSLIASFLLVHGYLFLVLRCSFPVIVFYSQSAGISLEQHCFFYFFVWVGFGFGFSFGFCMRSAWVCRLADDSASYHPALSM